MDLDPKSNPIIWI